MRRQPLTLPSRDSFNRHLDAAERAYDERISVKNRSRLWRYLEMLVDEDSRQNLVRAKDGDDLVLRHLLDSLSLLPLLPFKAPNLLDAGSGAGLPGIPLAVMRPDIPITLVDSTQKRCRFLESVVADLKLKNVQVVRARLEDLAPTPTPYTPHPTPYTLITARALAPLAELIGFCGPLLAPGGFVLAQKGPKAAQELKEAEQALYKHGFHLIAVEPLYVPGLRATRLCIILRKPKPVR